MKLYISSSDRVNTSDIPCSCNFNLYPVSNSDQYRTFRLEYFEIPNSFYNILTNVNDSVCFNVGGTNYRFQIPPGQWDINTLLSTIQTGMNALRSNNFVLVYDTITFKINITGSASFTLNWATNPFSSSSCYKSLGFTMVDTVTATSITSPNVVSLAHPSSLYIELENIGRSRATSINSVSNTTFFVPLEQSQGRLCNIYRETVKNQVVLSSPISMSNFSVRIYDKNHRLLNSNGAEWHMVLDVE